jgi:hypothetical protein
LTHKLMSNIAVLRFDHLRDLLRQGELLLGGPAAPLHEHLEQVQALCQLAVAALEKIEAETRPVQ